MGPGVKRGLRIKAVLIEDLSRKGSKPIPADEKGILEAEQTGLFSQYGWELNTDKLAARYEIQVFLTDGSKLRFWLGTFADLNQPPCYGMCSGYWLAGSDQTGKMSEKQIRSLASSNGVFAVMGLLMVMPD